MEENQNVVTTPTVEKEGSKFGWGVLGFFIPLVGLILFLVWKNDKKKAAKASGIGALIGFGVGLITSALVFFGIISIFSLDKGAVGEKNITIQKAKDKTNNFAISDSEYVMDWSHDFITSEVAKYNAVDSTGRKLFQIEHIFIYNKTKSVMSYKIITNKNEEIKFDDYYEHLNSYNYYNFYYKNDIVIFNVGNNNTGYYFYDLKQNELYKVFTDDDTAYNGLMISDISMTDDDITFKVEFNSEDAFSYTKKSIYDKLIKGEYSSIDDLYKDLKIYKLEDFIVSETIKYHKDSNSYSSDTEVKKITDLYNEKYNTTVERTKDCTGEYTKGSNKYEYVMNLEKEATGCKTITYKLTDDFTVKYEIENQNTWTNYTMYVNGEAVDSGLLWNKEIVYINGKTLITRAFSTDEGAPVLLVNTKGEIYSVEGYTNGNAYTGKDILNIDGMTKKGLKVDDEGNLIVSGSKHSNQCGERIGDDCLSQPDICATSFEDLASKYGIDDNYIYNADYIFKLNSNGLYDLNYSDVKTTKTWHEYYNGLCNR